MLGGLEDEEVKHGVAAAKGCSLEGDEEDEAAVGGLTAGASGGALVEVTEPPG